ncbi:MAG TPA: hypothetical protein VF667_10760 [Pseudonocardia sp.]|jgi:hypothetical protein
MSAIRTDSRVAAQVVHDLGAALWFGGTVMGVAGVNKSGQDLRDGLDKVRAAESAWRRFAPVQWLGIGAVLVAGSRLTLESKGRLALQHGVGRAGAAQAGFAVAGAAATGFAAWSGRRIGQLTEQAAERRQHFDTTDATIPNDQTPPEIVAWQRRQRVAQYLVPAFAGANIVLNAYLTQQYRPGASVAGIARRLLPGS